ncbi:MAG: GNAT family N-acetyltransferase [Pseudomonadota bacterium]
MTLLANTIEVRPVTAADSVSLAELLNEIIELGGTTALEEPFTPQQLADTYLIGPLVLNCVVAVDDGTGELIGFQTLVKNGSLPDDIGDVATFAKVGTTQRGIGTSLFKATLARARELDLKAINATIRADNTGGLAFYSKMDFEDHDVTLGIPLADGTPVDRVHKRYSLKAGVSKGQNRKTLGLKDTSDTVPALNKKGRGWKISDKRLDELHDRAREMKRFASPAHKALAEKFAGANLGRYTFKRHAVVGSAIVDFNCHNLGMAIMIDEEDADEALAKRRDKSLEAVGIRVMRIKASDIMDNMDAVLDRITAGMRMRIEDKRQARRDHFNGTPNAHN